MDLSAYVDGISKTGFPLEHETVKILRAEGWNVISNKYYVDNDEDKPREVDLLAYKFSKKNPEFDLFTTLIISCKKSEHSVWAFLARESNFNDPNSDWDPVHIFANDAPSKFMMDSNKSWASDYHQKVRENGVTEVMQLPKLEIFALQEMANGARSEKEGKSLKEGKPLGDSQIFSSMMSLMKAQFYELSARHDKVRKKNAIYQFNLISLADTKLLRLHFQKDQITPSVQNSEHYIARYIFNRKEIFSRIVFVAAEYFKDILKDYGRLHIANEKIFMEQSNDFYDGIVTDPARLKVFEEGFLKKLSLDLRTVSVRTRGKFTEFKLEMLFWSAGENTLNIEINEGDLDFLNGNESKEKTKALLEKTFRYTGEFRFTDHIPF